MNKKTYYQIILDQSGSMNDCLQSTIDGYNRQIEIIRSLPSEFPKQEFFTSLTKFNSEPEHVFLDVPVTKLTPLSGYRPNGNTALLDALGECLFRLKADKQKEFAEDKATAAVVIITDGFENASKYFTLDIISRLIADLKNSGNFTIDYLGATLESIDQAARLRMDSRSTRRFDKSNMTGVFEDVANSLKDYASEKQTGKKPERLNIQKDDDEEISLYPKPGKKK